MLKNISADINKHVILCSAATKFTADVKVMLEKI